MIASEELREASPVGKEMIDGERVVQNVVPPARNKTRDAQRKKTVTEQIKLHGMADIQGDSAIVKSKFFSHFNVSKGHNDYKYALCKTCIQEDSLHLARVSRGATLKDLSSTSNMRQHLFVHHADQFDELLVLEGKGPTLSTGEGMKGHFLPKTSNRGAPMQDEMETLYSLLMLVTDEMDPWQSLPKPSTMTASAASLLVCRGLLSRVWARQGGGHSSPSSSPSR